MRAAPERPEVLILVLSEIRSDPRVLRQVKLLADRYAITTCGFGEAPDGVVDHIALGTEARGWPNDKAGLLLRRYDHVYWHLPAIVAAREALSGRSFDGVIANDLNTVPLATTVSSRGGFHADLHEYAPAEKENVLAWRLLVAPYQEHLLRRYAVRARSVTTVSPGIADAYREHFGLDCGVVPNAAPFERREPQPVHQPLRLLSTGVAQRARRIEVLIEAMRGVPDATLDLYLVPNEPAYLEGLVKLARDVPAVTFKPPVALSDLVDTVASHDVSLVFFPPRTFNLRHTLPNKFYEAVQARTAVVVGPTPDLLAITNTYGFGVVTDDFTAEALAETLRALTPERVTELKQAAHAAAWELSAEQSMAPWVEAVAAMAAASR